MKQLLIVIQTELFKAFKVRAIWLTVLMFTLVPLVSSFFMYVLKDPEFATSSGLLGAKAQIAGEASWPAFIAVQGQMIAVGGLIAYGFITSLIFGREFAHLTVKDLLALPYSRLLIVLGKFITSFMINIVLSLYIIAIGFMLGLLIDLPNWQEVISSQHLKLFCLVTLLTIILTTPVAFFATIGRGYLLGIGFIVIVLISSQLITVLGYGNIFPWAIPALMSGIVEEAEFKLMNYHWVILIGTSLLGVGLTLYSWLYIDYST